MNECPAPEGYESWPAYWQAQAMPWRTEPEIDAEWQRFLADRRAVTPNIEQGIYPFRDIKLTRADVEWLLATHESGGMRGPVDWSDEKQRTREGLDLRGADLRGANLSYLPLAVLGGGLRLAQWPGTTPQQREIAALHLAGAELERAHLEGSTLRQAHLAGADLYGVHLQRADLHGAHLEGANLHASRLDGADLRRSFMDTTTDLEDTTLGSGEYGSISLADVRWEGTNLAFVEWTQVKTGTRSKRISPLVLGDEYRARQRRWHDGRVKDQARRLHEYKAAVRTNRQLATTLRDQGLNESADQFAYRAQLLQRGVVRRQVFLQERGRRVGPWQRARRLVAYLGSLFLDLIAGYGYRPLHSVIAYVVIIGAFSGAYLLNAQFAAPHLTWDEALVLSISSFHGRGFFTSGISLGATLARLAAGEAIIGLLIEITFIATFTQRFFAR